MIVQPPPSIEALSAPSTMNETILITESEVQLRANLERTLSSLGYRVEAAKDSNVVLNSLGNSQGRIDAVLLDLYLDNLGGIDTLSEIRRFRPHMPVIVVSDVSSTSKVVDAMRRGATDFLTNPIGSDDLQSALYRALAHVKKAGDTPRSSNSVFFGQSESMKAVRQLAIHVGRSDVPVLIQGETGTGKEVIARELHAQSQRSGKIFLKLNCAALPSELLESELFGYERGAFTGAFQRKVGMFELADGGTLMLDEIGDLDFKLQAKLLHVLQDKEFKRIGGRETIRADVRVIAATHHNLENAIVERTFREDLYYRINVVNLHLPPLRERKEDILPLAEVLLLRHAGDDFLPIPALLRAALVGYNWPGNVRELENIMRRLIVLGDAESIAREIYGKIRNAVSKPNGPQMLSPIRKLESSGPILEQVTRAKQQAEADAILSALNSTQWNRKKAASLLQIDYKALLYKIKKLAICPKQTSAA